MAKQNIYDNEIFYEGYKKIRDNDINANTLIESGFSTEKMNYLRNIQSIMTFFINQIFC